MTASKKRGLGLGVHQGTVAAALNASVVQDEETRPKRRTARPDDVPMSIRLQKELYEELRRLSFEERVPIHSMILDGIRIFLKSKGIETPTD